MDQTNIKGRGERVIDSILAVLFILVVILVAIPALLSLFISPYCSGWNEGTMSGACNPSFLGELYNGMSGALLMLAFSGIIWLPIALVIGLIGLIKKIKRFMRGYRPQATRDTIKELSFSIPYIALIFLLIFLLTQG